MEPNENEIGNSSSKPVTGVRTAPALKDALINESAEAGISLSEYCETILYNRHKTITQVAEMKKEIERLKAQIASTGEKQFNAVQAENEELKEIIKKQNNHLSIYSDNRLLYLYDNLKGKTDTVVNAYAADFAITYDSPKQVLLALIYSSKLNP